MYDYIEYIQGQIDFCREKRACISYRQAIYGKIQKRKQLVSCLIGRCGPIMVGHMTFHSHGHIIHVVKG